MSKASSAFITDRYPDLGKGPVPVAPYIDPAYYEREKELIFKKTWLQVGRVEEIPKAGDYLVKDLPCADAELIIVRNKKGQINALHNVCSHRLNQIAYDKCGNTRKFACKFHGWAFDLDGNLTGVPEEECFFDLDKSANGLARVACDVWQGFIFVNLDPNPSQTLAEFLKPMFGCIEGYPFEKLTAGFSWISEVNCNWKLALDAFQEAYHVAYIHGRSIADAVEKSDNGTIPPLDAICGDYHRRLSLAGNQKSVYGNPKALTEGGEVARQAVEAARKSKPISAAALTAAMGSAKHEFPLEDLPEGMNWTRSDKWLFDINVVFPDLYLSLRPNYFQCYTFRPVAYNRTRVECRVFYPEVTTAGGRFFQEYMKVALRDVLLEDMSTVERTQRAAETGAKPHMFLQDSEILVRHNYHAVERMMQENAVAAGEQA
ncbi:aromatic ring-hydroxylating dioxygenase subunit alpha [Pseudomonas sp. BN515]|uniref:aromatic ring-hydroxylating oxygenase subunit alpha n=1 Tax=Pseudomonas sp. BN515 TaxID=2567892 RepID=UPI002458E6DA|nr:aromatic ring-hydroxylating dioxygenase subunit alpha [Pseudomonas sp. BN515]MDH4872019.1 aromatic ring-hydroxylating dioxygenase subunit alpha [Pseudomonas sp. BN515]